MFALSKEDQTRCDELHKLMFQDSGRRAFTPEERKELNRLWELQNFGKILPKAQMLPEPKQYFR